MKQVSRQWLLLAMAGAVLICSLACNNSRSDQTNDSTSTDAAANPDTATMTSGSPAFSKTLTFRQYSFTVNEEGEGACAG